MAYSSSCSSLSPDYNSFHTNQARAMEDYIETLLMVQYKKSVKEKYVNVEVKILTFYVSIMDSKSEVV